MSWEIFVFAWLIGMAKPMFWAGSWELPVSTAVFMPITCPAEFTRGPPEFPGLMAASVCSRPERLSPPELRVRLSAETMPSVTVGWFPRLRALPMARTPSPT